MPTTNYGWPLVAATATVDIPRDINALANAVDTSLKPIENRVAGLEGKLLIGVSTARPAVAVGSFLFETDTNRLMVGVSIASVGYWVPLPGAHVLGVRQTVQQSGLPTDNVTTAAINFQTIDYDPFGVWVGPTRFTPKFPGRFEMLGGVGFTSTATGFRAVIWFKNGAAIAGSNACHEAVSAGGISVPARPTVVAMNGTTDYVEMRVLNYQGPTTTTISNDYQSTMSAIYCGPQ